MNAFDWVKVHHPLPQLGEQDIAFQTTDLFRRFNIYTITKDGRLVLPAYRYDGDEEVYYGSINMLYHGRLRFFGLVGCNGAFVCFDAFFWEGKLKEIQENNPAVGSMLV